MRDFIHDSHALRGYFVWISRRKNLNFSARQWTLLSFEEGMLKCGNRASLGFFQPSL